MHKQTNKNENKITYIQTTDKQSETNNIQKSKQTERLISRQTNRKTGKQIYMKRQR